MLRIITYSSLVVLFIFATLFNSDPLGYLVGLFANIAIIVSLIFARGLYLYSGIIFYSIAITIFFVSDMSWSHFLLQFDSMLGILSLFLLLPFLNSLITVGEYDQHLSSLLSFKVSNLGDLYKRSSYVSHILGLFLNIATIPLLLNSLKEGLKNVPRDVTNVFYSRSLLRAYALCLMWSPMEILIIQTISMTNVDYIVMFPFLIIFVLLMLLFDTKFSSGKYNKHTMKQQTTNDSLHLVMKKISDLFFLLVLLVLAVTLLTIQLGKGYLFSLVLLIIPVSLLWSIKIQRSKQYVKDSINHWISKTKGLYNYFFMFLSAGFFVKMLATTRVIAYLQHYSTYVSTVPLLLYIFISVYFLLTAFIGFHPLVTIAMLEIILQPIMPSIAGIPITIVIIISSLSTVMYSPFNVSVSILASEINVNPYKIGMWNLFFALFLISCGIMFAYFIYFIQQFILG